MTRYADFDKLRELTKLTKTGDGYSKFIQTGQLSLGDYGVGFIDLEMSVYQSRPDSNYKVLLWFGTIDDGDFAGRRECSSEQEARDLVDRIAHEVFEGMVAFPNDDELNEELRTYGIYVCHE
jgi:hypothetical protein